MDLSEIPFESYYIIIALVSIWATYFIVTKRRTKYLKKKVKGMRKEMKDFQKKYEQMKTMLRMKDEEITQLRISKEEEMKNNMALKDENALLRLENEQLKKAVAKREEEIRKLHLLKDEALKTLKTSNEEYMKNILRWTEDQMKKYQTQVEDLKNMLNLREIEEKKKLQLKNEEVKQMLQLKDEEIKTLELAKEEEVKQLQSTLNGERKKVETLTLLLFPQKAEDLLKITSRTQWGSKSEVVRQRRGKAAEYVIVDGHSYNESTEDYISYMQIQESHQVKYFGDLSCNYWISDNGNVFEGLGWNSFNYVYNGGLGERSIKIAFIKKNGDDAPSATAISVFGKLLKAMICADKLSAEYAVIPYFLIFDNPRRGNKSFERNEMQNWVGYKSNLDFLFPKVEKELHPIISRLQWGGSKSSKELKALSGPIEYLVVENDDPRCFFNCREYLKVFERNWITRHGYMYTNFILSEDGMAYEAEGWEKTWYTPYQEKKVVTVTFSGRFNSYSPNERVFWALDALIQEGLRKGKLSDSFKIIRYPKLMGKGLEPELRKLPQFSEELIE